jgi:hypothetical protein
MTVELIGAKVVDYIVDCDLFFDRW